MTIVRRSLAEFLGTFWLVFGGCGSVVLAAGFPGFGAGFASVALAFGLAAITMAYAIGHISGCHLNPAVTIGLWAGGRFARGDILAYVVGQLGGATMGAWVLYLVASGAPGFDLAVSGFAANGFGAHSPGGYSLEAGLLVEALLTFFLLLIIMGATDSPASAGLAPVAMGLGVMLVHLIALPVTEASANPARSTGTAMIQGGWALSQLWLFWVAPAIGGLLGGLAYRLLVGTGWADAEPVPARVKLDPRDRHGTRVRVGATVIDHSDGAVGIVRSIGTKAWIDVDGRRRGTEYHDVEVQAPPPRGPALEGGAL